MQRREQQQHEVDRNTRGEKGLSSSMLHGRSSRLSQSQQQRRPLIAALWDSTPKLHRSGSLGSGLCRDDVDVKSTPKQTRRRSDLKSSNGTATIEDYVKVFRYLSILNRTSPSVEVNNSILESDTNRSRPRPNTVSLALSSPRQYKKSFSDSNLRPRPPPPPSSPATTATTTSSRSSASAVKSCFHLPNVSSKGINVKNFHPSPPPPPPRRSPKAQNPRVVVAAGLASSSAERNVKDTVTTQLNQAPAPPQRIVNGNRQLVAQYHRHREIDISPIEEHFNEITSAPLSRFAEVKDEWPEPDDEDEDSRLHSDIVLEPCDDDSISCVSMPTTIQYNR
mmetsp:Transcript_29719/g.43694  ORF Transcript_29719/g.43694 Transcript_29719/m.43694 type:complete len:336 (-) Transcript_29719:12-1019(-)